jgi:hypothetical protein
MPILPIAQGANLPSLDRNEDVQEATMQDAEIEHFEEVLNMEPGEAEEEVIELDDGSVIINYKPKEGPNQNPEFYANLAEELDEDVLSVMANDFLDLLDVDKESRKDRDKQY